MPGQQTFKLEPDLAEPYWSWRSTRTPQTTGRLLKAVQPSIDKAIAVHVGKSDPLLQSRARRLALGAFDSYDPERAGLGTHIVNQLQGLKRVVRQQRQIISVPERVVLDRSHVIDAENTLKDKLGREPTMVELADHTGLSLKRLRYVNRYRQPVAEGWFSGSDEEDEYSPAVEGPASSAWLEMVYGDADPTNKKILEWSLGLHGLPQLSNQEIASRLRLTPGAISQRKLSLQRTLDQEKEFSPFQ